MTHGEVHVNLLWTPKFNIDLISFDIILILFRQLKSLKFVHEAYQLTLIILRSQPIALFMFHDFDCSLIQESSSVPLNKTKNASLLLLSSCHSWSLWWWHIIQECHWQQIKIKWDAKQMKTKMMNGRRLNMQMQDMRWTKNYPLTNIVILIQNNIFWQGGQFSRAMHQTFLFLWVFHGLHIAKPRTLA